jgi:PAS domain S-box-containing protein
MSIFNRIPDKKRGGKTLDPALYLTLAEEADEGIAVVQDSMLRFMNPRFRSILGIAETDWEGARFESLVASPPLGGLVELYEKIRARGNAPDRAELGLKRPGGDDIAIEITARSVRCDGRPAELLVVRDVTSRRRAEQRSAELVGKLRKTMGATIQALASTVESRDPTTAGHQRRVSDLARTIAVRLGFSAERTDAVRLAGSIHDLGKIAIPSEILNKPGHLSETELVLVRTHAQVGHEILSRIDFPWPIARIVLQHHERMDGSGYPNGLKGREIMIEARILAVADVVEAMIAHRPYRTAHSLAEALAEINRGRGVLYDMDAADMCLRLFVSREYQFSR